VTIHLAFDQLQVIDLSFGLSIAPGHGEGSAYRTGVLLQPGSKRFHCRHATFAGFGEPGIQFSTGCCGIGLVAGVAPTHKGGEPAGEHGHGRGVLILFDTCDRCSVGCWQHCGELHEQPRDGSVKNLGRYAASGIAWWPKRPSSTAALT